MTNTRPLPNHFDRGKPFYPLVVNYLVQLVGFKELGLRGIAGPQDPNEIFDKVPALGRVPPGKQAEPVELKECLSKLMGPLQLRSEYQANQIEVDVDEVARDIAANSSYLASFLMRSAGSLLILAHEISKDAPWHDQGHLWEFLRHCRNAAAHRGSFNFLHGEPLRPAQWGPFHITASFQGTPLFKEVDGRGLISPGDPIRLLWDIEQAYPQMNA